METQVPHNTILMNEQRNLHNSPDGLHDSFDSSDVDEVVDVFLLQKLLFCVLSLLVLLELLVVLFSELLLLLFSS